MNGIDTTSWWRRLDGDVLTSWPVFALTFALSLVMTGLTSSAMFIAQPFAMLSSFTTAQVVMWICLRFGGHVTRRRGDLVSPGVVIAIIVGSTAMRGATLGLATMALGITDSPDWFLRVVGSIFSLTIALVVSTSVVASVREHRERLGRLRDQQAALRLAHDTVARVINEQRSAVVAQIRELLAAQVDAMDAGRPDATIAALRSATSDIVRPMSRELAMRGAAFTLPEPTTPMRTRWPDVIADATRQQPIQAVWIAAGYTLLAAPWAFTAFLPSTALVLLLAGLTYFTIACSAAASLFRILAGDRGPVLRATLLTGLLAAVGVVGGLGARWLLDDFPGTSAVVLGDALLVPILGWLLAIARATRHQQRHLEGEFRRVSGDLEWALARINEEQWHQRRSLSRALHGPVQSAIGAAAIRLELAVRQGLVTPALVDDLRTSIIAALDFLDADPQTRVDVLRATEDQARLYDQVCSISTSIEPRAAQQLDDDQVAATTVVDLMSEAIFNAVRHGHAEAIEVGITQPQPQSIRLRIGNDGTSEPANAPGLGTQQLDEVSLAWNRRFDGERTVLTVDLPTRGCGTDAEGPADDLR